jgi:hypothetical protein
MRRCITPASGARDRLQEAGSVRTSALTRRGSTLAVWDLTPVEQAVLEAGRV